MTGVDELISCHHIVGGCVSHTGSVLNQVLLETEKNRASPCSLFPGGSDDKESACNVGDPGSIPGSGRSPGEEHGYSCLENPHGQRSLVGYSPWGYKELDMTE